MHGLAAGFWWINMLLCAYCTFYWARNRMNDGTPGLMTPGGQVWAWQLVFCFIVLVLDISPWHLFWLGLVSFVLSVIVSNVWRGRMLAARYPDIGRIEVPQRDMQTVPTPVPTIAPTVAQTVAPTLGPSIKLSQAATPPKVSVPQENGMADYWYQKALLLTDESQYLECLQCLERAVDADSSHVQSLYGIAHHYLHGFGVDEDLPTAAKWFREAAELGFSPAQDKLGLMYEHGMGVAKNWREAAKWYLMAAEKGFADSQYHLGVIYANGQGFPIDFKASVKWCIKAAEQGHSEAQSTLGRIFLKGVDGIPRDAAEASKWLRKAADQGDAESQFDIGYLFELGDGVLQDLEEAARYYGLSAEQGYADGQRGIQRINLILGRHSISTERLPNEEDWQYQMRRMVEQTRFVPQRKQ
jgi:TPR repeat protein